MTRWRKKSVEIDAVRFEPDVPGALEDLPEWLTDAVGADPPSVTLVYAHHDPERLIGLSVHLPDGPGHVPPGGWVVRDADGSLGAWTLHRSFIEQHEPVGDDLHASINAAPVVIERLIDVCVRRLREVEGARISVTATTATAGVISESRLELTCCTDARVEPGVLERLDELQRMIGRRSAA